MIASLQDFEESTAFELYALENVCPVVARDAGLTTIDLRDPNPSGMVHDAICSLAQTVTDALRDQLAPLLFGAAWKVLDMVIEFALCKAYPRKNADSQLLITEKIDALSKGMADPCVLGASKSVWEALEQLYKQTVDHRHSLVHRADKVDIATGTMVGTDKKGTPLLPLTRQHQLSFAKVGALVARGVLGGGIDERSEEHLKYELDKLTQHTKHPAFGVSGSSAPANILLELEEENGSFFLNMCGVLDRARKSCPAERYFNVLVNIPGDSGRRLFGYAEKFPQGRSHIDLVTLPSWLEYR
jgi:hypothetical protein